VYPVGMVGIVYPGMVGGCTMVGVQSSLGMSHLPTLGIPSRHHPRVHEQQRGAAGCVRDDDALGSTLRIIWETGGNRASLPSKV